MCSVPVVCSWLHRMNRFSRGTESLQALSHGTRLSRVSSSFSMGDMRKAANRKRFCWRRGGGAQAVLMHPKSCRFHEHGASRQAPPKIKIFYLFVSGSGSRVGFNQSENWLLTTTCNISLSCCRSVENMMKIAVNPTGIPGVIHQNLRDIYIYKNKINK